MRRPISARFAALALAPALCAVAVLFVAGHRTRDVRLPEYSTTPAEAVVLLSRLAAPTGFHRAACRAEPEPQFVACFAARRSIVPGVDDFAARLRAVGLSRRLSGVHCGPEKHFPKPRLRYEACTADASVGRDRLLVSIRSLVLDGPGVAKGTERHVAHLPDGSVEQLTGGSTIAVRDLGALDGH